METFEINIGLFGCVSVGKSTFLNAIAGQQFSDAEIKKTTMVPQVYIESKNASETTNAQIIRRNNREVNDSIEKMIDLNEFSADKCQPLCHNVDRICDLFDPVIVDPRFKINIYDIPGLNDSASKNIYFEWVKQNIKLFDIVIFMTDINRGLSNSDEIEILNLLMESIKKYNSKMICLMNKCDDIYFDEDENDLVFEEKEQENIYLQANNILADIAKNYGIECCDEIFTPFFPISSENCFIYRALFKNPDCKLDQIHLNRLCKNECGSNQWKKMDNDQKELMFQSIVSNLKLSYDFKIRDTGYLNVKSIIQKTIISNKDNFIQNHVNNSLNELELSDIDNTETYKNLISSYIEKLSQAEKIGVKISYDLFWKKFCDTITNYANNVSKIKTKIIKGRDFIDFEEFETMHSNLQVHCMNFSSIIESVCNIPNYPNQFIKTKFEQLFEKLIEIYDQIIDQDHKDYVHTRPSNLLQYLQTINTYAPHEFNSYSIKFLNIACSANSKHISSYQSELQELVVYVIKNIKDNILELDNIIAKILIEKQKYIYNKHNEQYFEYLIKMKKMVKKYNRKIKILPNKYNGIDILYEVICKNISLHLTMNSMSNIYKQEIDYDKVNNLFNKLLDKTIASVDIKFEQAILNSLAYKKLNN
ncbi:hypothetical protein QJ857_gp1351 [Tupanvirus soda lake]|uniref:Dynamin N-terminal domain-containing protein n=2 Tax=Tupanvirus TaxID=2094720 RepID=A0A6N1P081_9VIRU|nr:hypothetical protein QJ857_gp1351 [Tupanvirus soda lake]QKU34711.1 hypothetical protein [Tupanvirus soda lake]